MEQIYLIISTLLMCIGAAIFSSTGVVMPLWIIVVFLAIYAWRFSNYATVRLIIYLNVLVISLCGDTNFTLRFAVVDFIITFITVLFNGHSVPRRYKLFPSWAVLLICGTIGGLFYAIDKTSFHVGIEVYGLLLATILSTEFISAIQRVNLKLVMGAVCSTNAALMTIFWMSNTIPDLLTKTRALIYLLGDSGIRSNSLAGILVAFLVILFSARNFFSSKPTKIVNYIIIAFDIVTLLFLQSRGGYIGIAAAIFMAFIENVVKKRTFERRDILKAIIVIAAIVVLLSLPQIQNILWEYVLKRFFSLSNTSDISNGRIFTYLETYRMWQKHIFFGNGFLQFAAFNILNADPHNWVLGYLASTGIFGTIAFTAFIIICLRPYNTSGTLSKAFRYSVFAQVIHGLFEPILTQNLPLSLFVVICMIGYFCKTEELNDYVSADNLEVA